MSFHLFNKGHRGKHLEQQISVPIRADPYLYEVTINLMEKRTSIFASAEER